MSKRSLSTMLFIAVLIVIALVAFGCQRNPVPVGLEIPTGTFNDIYDIDEELSVEGKKIYLVYSDGSKVEEELLYGMVSNFDTSTTGKKAGIVKFREFTESFTYTVEYSARPELEIATSARVSLSAEPQNKGKAYTISLDVGDLDNIGGIYFSVNFIEGIADGMFSNIVATCARSDWDYIAYYLNSHTVRYLLYAKDVGGYISDSGNLFLLSILADSEIDIFDIVLSDGISDYNLPGTEVL